MSAFKIVSFNLRCVFDGDGKNNFLSRAGGIINRINKEKPDVIAFQEATDQNIELLSGALNEYQIFFNQRNDDFGGEGIATAIKRDAVCLLALDFFWLSKTPYIPGSRYEIQSEYPRICQCLLLKLKADGKRVWVYNNHLDHEGDQARILGIKQVLERISADVKRYPAPFFLLGDFNAVPDSETIRFCDNYEPLALKELSLESGVTFHNFGNYKEDFLPAAENERAGIKIDYIFTDSATELRRFTKWTEERDGVFLSDHYPLCAEVEI